MCKSDDVPKAAELESVEPCVYERHYDEPREDAMMGYRYTVGKGLSLESLKQYIRKKWLVWVSVSLGASFLLEMGGCISMLESRASFCQYPCR